MSTTYNFYNPLGYIYGFAEWLFPSPNPGMQMLKLTNHGLTIVNPSECIFYAPHVPNGKCRFCLAVKNAHNSLE